MNITHYQQPVVDKWAMCQHLLQQVLFHPHFRDAETEAQRDLRDLSRVTQLSLPVAELAFKPR